MKNFCPLKATTKNMKRQATTWENIFIIHVPTKKLRFEIHKQFLQVNKKKADNPKKYYKNIECLLEENIQMAINIGKVFNFISH